MRPATILLILIFSVPAAGDSANLTIGVTKVPGGDGFGNVGYINATGHDLGTVFIKGDLGQIDAGTDSATVPAIKSLTVNSLGRLGTDTQMTGGTLESDVTGALGSLSVKHDIASAFVNVTGANGRIGAVAIGGSLIGNSNSDSGEIFSSRDMGTVKIGHDFQGGSGLFSGLVKSTGKLAGVTIGGSLIGGPGFESGEIFSTGDMGAVKIGQDLQGGLGGLGGECGYIESDGKLAGVRVGGSLIGGSGGYSGTIFSKGDMGPVKIGHDVRGGTGILSGCIASSNNLASVQLGGSLIGGSNIASGVIGCSGDMDVVKITHDVQGGSGFPSGRIAAGRKLAGVSIGGSLIGGSGSHSGEIYSDVNMGTVKIARDVQGGSGSKTGDIASDGKLAGVSIGNSLIGGSGNDSGEIYSNLDMGAVKIGHDLTGGSIIGSASLNASGLIQSNAGRIDSVTIGGSIISGSDASSGTLTINATIRAANDIGSLTVKGNLLGHVGDGTPTNLSPVIISARGQEFPSPGINLAIGRITIGGHVEFANIFAGYDNGLNAVNGDAQIGAVSVGGDWVASNLVAGAMNTASSFGMFGDGHDVPIGAGSPNIVAKIASIAIAGQVFGTPDSSNSTDHFGFVTEQIDSLKIGGSTILLTVGRHNDSFTIGETNDMAVREI